MKKSLTDLAILGGARAFKEELHVGKPNISRNRNHLFERINDILDRRWLTNNGVYVQELEKRISDYLGVNHCIAMCNGTIALEIAIRALGLKGEVIVPSFTFVATAHALQWQEITPVFCDVGPGTYTIDPARVKDMITPRTTGIIGVHLWGNPCDTDELKHIADQHQLKLVYDASHAFGCSHQGKMIGGFGDAEIFSFHATKFFNTFEGGAVITNNHELAEKIRLMKNFGFQGHDRVVHIGVNGKMNEVSAAMGLTSLENLEEFIHTNRKNHELYKIHLNSIPGIKLMPYSGEEKNNYQYIILTIEEKLTGIGRDKIVQVLQAENIIARRYFFPGCHRMEPYRSYFPHAGLLLPYTEELTQKVIALPTGTAISESAIITICQIIRYVVENAGELSGGRLEKL